jgi:hypothetical protein
MRPRTYHDLTGDPIEAFLEFGFPELRSLCLVFIFLSAAFLLASIFSLRAASNERRILWLGSVGSWALFSFAVATGGHGLWRLYQVAESLVINRGTEGFTPQQYSYYVQSTYSSLDKAGYALVLGILAYVSTHALQGLLKKQRTTTTTETKIATESQPKPKSSFPSAIN